MRKQLRPLALFACITAATAFGSQIAAAATAPPDTQSEARCGEHRHMGHHFLKRLAKQLGLSAQQQSQAKAILKSSRQENKPLMLALFNEKHQLHALMLSGSADEAAIREQSAKIASVQADLAVKRAQEAKQLLAILTPDQASKLRAIMEKREQKFKKFISGEQPAMQ